MLRRQRMGLLVAVIFLVVAVVIAGGVVWLIQSGTIERQISRQWSQHLPGTLTVSAVRVADLDRMRISDLSLELAGEPFVTCQQADVSGQVQQGSLTAIELVQPELYLHAATLPAVRDFLRALQELNQTDDASDGPPVQPPTVVMHDGALVVEDHVIARFDATVDPESILSLSIRWFGSDEQGLKLQAQYTEDTGLTWNDLSGSIPVRKLMHRLQPLWGAEQEELTPWLADSWQVEAANPFEVHLRTFGGWQANIVDHITIATTAGGSGNMHIHWRENVGGQPVHAQWGDQRWSFKSGSFPVHAILHELREHKLPSLGPGAQRWLPKTITPTGTYVDLAQQRMQLVLSFSLLESEKLLIEATEQEKQGLQERPNADLILTAQRQENGALTIQQLQVRQGVAQSADYPMLASNVLSLVSGTGQIEFQEQGPAVDVWLEKWGSPVAYEIWNNGLRLGELAPLLPKVHWQMRPGLDPVLLATGENGASYSWAPTANPWQMELANIPLRYADSLDADLNLYAGLARRGVVQGSWVTRDNGRVTVGDVTVAIQGERADAHYLGWGANDFTGHVTLKFTDLPLTLRELRATGHDPDLTFTMERDGRKEPWRLQLVSPSLSTAIQHAQLPMFVPPLKGGAFQLHGILADNHGEDWRIKAQGMSLNPVFSEVDTDLAATWQLDEANDILTITGTGTARKGTFALEGVQVSPQETLHLGYRLPIDLNASVGLPSRETPAEIAVAVGKPEPGSLTLSASGSYDWQSDAGSVDVVTSPVSAVWAMTHLQPWMGDAVEGLTVAGHGPVVVGFDLADGGLSRLNVDIALLRHDMQWGPISAQGVTGPVRIQTPEALERTDSTQKEE